MKLWNALVAQAEQAVDKVVSSVILSEAKNFRVLSQQSSSLRSECIRTESCSRPVKPVPLLSV